MPTRLAVKLPPNDLSLSSHRPGQRLAQCMCRRPAKLPMRSFSSTSFNQETPGEIWRRNSISCSKRRGSRSIIARRFKAQEKAQERLSARTTAPSKRVLSLIQPTGIPHLGNYLGALRPWRDLQEDKINNVNKNELIFGLADLHSLTLKQPAAERSNNIQQTAASLLAIGLDPAHCHLFCQSEIPAHSELMWLLSTAASTGKLTRMTQWKDKLGIARDNVEQLDDSLEKLKLGLFTYPVLQAADILIYDPDLVPVGEDQQQHIEFARSVAKSFNSMFAEDLEGPIFLLPKPVISPAARIKSLQDPSKKMSKSDRNPDSKILITDHYQLIIQKIKAAKTDSISGPISYDPENRPGVSNLIDILRYTTRSRKTPDEICESYAGKNLGDLKADVADCLVNEFAGIRERFINLMEPGDKRVGQAFAEGFVYCQAYASQKVSCVKRELGLVPIRNTYMNKERKFREKIRKEEEKTKTTP